MNQILENHEHCMIKQVLQNHLILLFAWESMKTSGCVLYTQMRSIETSKLKQQLWLFPKQFFSAVRGPTYSISHEICTRFCCVLLCCGYAIVHNEFT